MPYVQVVPHGETHAHRRYPPSQNGSLFSTYCSTRSLCARACALLDEGESPIRWRLVQCQTFTSDVLHVIYAPAESTPAGMYEEAKAHLPQRKNS